jgi:16S rRNA (cytosine967-C5)-methyltransferase
MSMIAPARLVSYQILLQIATSDTHSDELLRSPEVDRLSTPDRNLTTTLVLGTLRWQLALDARIRQLLARPEARLSAAAASALRMGAYQLGYLDRVPAHAVIHDSVELVKQGKEPGAAGMVNAVLRKIAAQGKFLNAGPSTPPVRRSDRHDTSVVREIAAAWAHPEWMVERWVLRYGRDAAQAICQCDQEPAGLSLRVAGASTNLEGIETEPGAFLRSARRVIRGDVGRSAAFRDGRVRIQDEASQLVAEIAAAAAPHAERVLDTCAAPGGKTAILAERLPDAEITAVDVSRKRLDVMRKLASGSIAKPVRFEVTDAAKLELKPEWDLILCDVPCSGTGTMARNPEIRLRVSEQDLGRQHARQVAILQAALRGLAPKGRLVYSTCSLEPEENENVLDEVLRETPGFVVVPMAGILDRLAESGVVTMEGRERLRTATDGAFLRTLPGVHPCDGFFAAVLEHSQR